MSRCGVLYLCAVVVVVWSCCCCMSADGTNNTTTTTPTPLHSSKGIVIFKFDFTHVATPFIVCSWVLLASLAKIVFHHSEWLSNTFPESCLLILLGLPIGGILQESGINDIFLTSNLFFYYLLPPIILDAGYFMPSQVFYLNIGTILLYAILGTIFNTFAVGVSLFFVRDLCDIEMGLLHALLFGSLISAVDPVAVLAVFEEVHVHEILYMLVFGESVLNDAASVVLYRTFESLVGGTVDAKQVGLAIASFFVVSFGGTMIGVIFALLTSFITKFTEHVRVIEPVFVFLMAYMAYLSAEIFHFSGIMSILFCGVVMKPYVESNVSRKSHTTIKYFMKLLSSSCESIIFMFLGAALVQYNHVFNLPFLCFTLLFTSAYRAVGVTLLTGLANKWGRLTKVKRVEQFIMSYGGLRGAVAFCLAILIKTHDSSDIFKRTMVTTTIGVVIFTCFVQGTTIKKLVDILGVKKSVKRDKTMVETVNYRVLGYMVAGVEEIIGVHGHGFWSDLMEFVNKKYLRRWLERDPDVAYDDNLLSTQRRIAFKHALEYANNPSMFFARESDIEELDLIKQNPSVCFQLALRAQSESTGDRGVLDMNALSDYAGGTYAENMCTDAFNPRTISSLIPKAQKQESKKTFSSKKKYTMTALDEDDAIEDRVRDIQRNQVRLRHLKSTDSTDHHRGHHHHHHHHHHRKHKHKNKKGRSKKPEMETLPELTEQEDTVLDRNKEVKPTSVHLDIPEEMSGNEDDDMDHGILFEVNKESEETDGLFGEESDYVPALPTYSDSTSYLNRYTNQPIVDYMEPKTLSERVKEDLLEAKRWRSFSIESAGPDDPTLISNGLVETPPSVFNSETESIVPSPWTDSPSSPPRSYLNEFDSGGPRRSTRDRAYSIETGF